MKFLLVLIVVAVAIWLLTRPRRSAGRRRDASPGGGKEAEPPRMIACAHCGVHLPLDETLVGAGSRRYCCEAHRALGPD